MALGVVMAVLVGAVVGALLTYKTAINISKEQAFNKVAAVFRDAFIRERLLFKNCALPRKNAQNKGGKLRKSVRLSGVIGCLRVQSPDKQGCGQGGKSD
jgi:uncharacterized membrane protein YqgA involved in biofilm formation